MAISLHGPIVGPISGKLGGGVFYQGARSGVIANTPSRSPSASDEQLTRRAALGRARDLWNQLTPTHKRLWGTFAATLPWSNRLGVRRPLSGYLAFLSYALQIDPHQRSYATFITPPQGFSTASPAIVSAAFHANGSCILTTQAPPAGHTFEYLYLRTMRQYGSRTAPGRTTYIGALQRWGTSLEWNTPYTPLNGLFPAGESLQIRIYWMSDYKWPSQRASIQTVAL